MNNIEPILLVEDGEDDIFLVLRAFELAKLANPWHVVRNGEQAIAYLKGEGPYGDPEKCPLPTLVLLDLRMPGKNGFEVLEWIRQQPGLSTLRVVVMTTSADSRDVNRAYQLGANSFLVKPMDFEEFMNMTLSLSGHWLWMSQAPEISRLFGSSGHDTK